MTETDDEKSPNNWPTWALLVLTLLLGLYVLVLVNNRPTTDDAYVYADTIDVVPQVSGHIIEMSIKDNHRVSKGDLLFRIDPRPYEDELEAAEAKLNTLDKQIELALRDVQAQVYNAEAANAVIARAEAQLSLSTDTFLRKQDLYRKGFVSAEDFEQALTAKRSAEAELDSALKQAKQAQAAISGVDDLVAQKAEVLAQISKAKLNLEYTEVWAPFDGYVASLRTTVGQFASAQQPVCTLIDARRWYVVANFRETDLKDVRAGTPATLYLMSDESKTFDGKVDSISYGVLPDDGGRVVSGLPAVARSINWVHVSQRFPVKIEVQDPDPHLFRVGTSAAAILFPERATEREE